jgi:hypothetical protein
MTKAEILNKLNDNKAGLQLLNDRLSGGHGVDEGEEMLKEQAELLDERDALMHELSSFHSAGLFTLRRTVSINPNNPTDARRQCATIAQEVLNNLLLSYHGGEITKEMYDYSHNAINNQLQFLHFQTTPDAFKACITEIVDEIIFNANTTNTPF